MLETLNQRWFLLLNASALSQDWQIGAAQFIAHDLIYMMPCVIIILWLWGPRTDLNVRRQFLLKTIIALTASLIVSWFIGQLFPHPRPFAIELGNQFLYHAPDNSFPSDHATSSFAFALAFLFWYRQGTGILLFITATAIAWSRVYLGVHWPMDMVAGLLTGICGCLMAGLIWHAWGGHLYQGVCRLYRLCFARLIRKGWVCR